MENTKQKFKKKMEGVVVSDTNDKTIVVKVERRFKHLVYSKFVTKAKKYHAHDENNKAVKGDRVVIIESRPYSKLKKWALHSIRA